MGPTHQQQALIPPLFPPSALLGTNPLLGILKYEQKHHRKSREKLFLSTNVNVIIWEFLLLENPCEASVHWWAPGGFKAHCEHIRDERRWGEPEKGKYHPLKQLEFVFRGDKAPPARRLCSHIGLGQISVETLALNPSYVSSFSSEENSWEISNTIKCWFLLPASHICFK